MPSPAPLPAGRALRTFGGRRDAEHPGLQTPPNFAGSSLTLVAGSVPVFGRAGGRGRAPRGGEGLKIQSRWFESISQMSNWLPSPLARPHGPPAGTGGGSCPTLASKVGFFLAFFLKKKKKRQKASWRRGRPRGSLSVGPPVGPSVGPSVCPPPRRHRAPSRILLFSLRLADKVTPERLCNPSLK